MVSRRGEALIAPPDTYPGCQNKLDPKPISLSPGGIMPVPYQNLAGSAGSGYNGATWGLYKENGKTGNYREHKDHIGIIGYIFGVRLGHKSL